ncbi:hypothetical protein C0J52_26900 [Blattella germanica]|nr:hypothetical protein C0J52_26900 [Blattella germanica]
MASLGMLAFLFCAFFTITVLTMDTANSNSTVKIATVPRNVNRQHPTNETDIMHRTISEMRAILDQLEAANHQTGQSVRQKNATQAKVSP